MLKVEHIGIAVKSFSDAIPLFEKLLNTSCYKIEMVKAEKVNTAFFQKGETKIELLESIDEPGVITRFIEKKGEGTSAKTPILKPGGNFILSRLYFEKSSLDVVAV